MASSPETTGPDIVARLRAVDHMSVEDCFLQSHLYASAAAEIAGLRELLRQERGIAEHFREAAARAAGELFEPLPGISHG